MDNNFNVAFGSGVVEGDEGDRGEEEVVLVYLSLGRFCVLLGGGEVV